MNIPIAVTSKKLDFNSLILEYDSNQTELHKAVRRNKLESLRSNIRSDNIDSKTKSGWTILHYAVLSNNLEAVKVLFHEELFQNNLSNVDLTHGDQRKLLYRAPTPKVNIADNNGLTAVHLAVINNNIEILSLLLRYKAEVTVCDVFGRTPLHYTASESATKKLLTHTSLNQNEKTLISAIRTIIFNITLQSPFKNICRDFVNMPDKKGNTPLHSVINRHLLKEQSCECIETLLETGANPYLFNHSGTSALDLIKSSCDTVQYINNSARYEQSIKKTYKEFVVAMFFHMAVTFGLATYLSSVTKKESQNASWVRPVAESGNITLIQVTTRSTNVILLIMVLPWLLLIQFYNRNSHLLLQCIFFALVLIIWVSCI